MSDGIIGKIDDMGSRIDELEKSIGDIMQQAGIEDEGDEEGGGEGEGEGGEGAK
jgi:heat shock factor-binding protein 1